MCLKFEFFSTSFLLLSIARVSLFLFFSFLSLKFEKASHRLKYCNIINKGYGCLSKVWAFVTKKPCAYPWQLGLHQGTQTRSSRVPPMSERNKIISIKWINYHNMYNMISSQRHFLKTRPQRIVQKTILIYAWWKIWMVGFSRKVEIGGGKHISQ